MSVNFVVSDFISRIKVAQTRKFLSVRVIYSSFTLELLNILWEQGCIRSYACYYFKGFFVVEVKLKYSQNYSVIKNFNIISRPGLRVYWTLKEFFYNFFKVAFQGFYIISTVYGLKTSNDSTLLKYFIESKNKYLFLLGGEVVAKVFF